MLKDILLWCAVATGGFGFDVVDCYDSESVCEREYGTSFECTECFETSQGTLCPNYGVKVYD